MSGMKSEAGETDILLRDRSLAILLSPSIAATDASIVE
jgi:hypothetical protein